MDNAMTCASAQPVTQRPRYYARQLVTPAEPRDREVEAAKRKARAAERFPAVA